MILKSLSRRVGKNAAKTSASIHQLISYVMKYTSQEKEPTETATLILKHNIRARTLTGYVKSFERNESFRIYHRKDNALLFHEIISFSPRDYHTLTNDMLRQIAEKYVEVRGADNLFVISKHENTDAIHLHAVVSGVKTNGKSNRVTKSRFQKIKSELEIYQRTSFPQLQASSINHSAGKSKNEIVQLVKNIRQTDKQEYRHFSKSNMNKLYQKKIF